MIKQNIKPTKCALLFKPEPTDNNTYSPFEIQDNYSAVDYKEDQSYEFFDQGQELNPYQMELLQIKPQSSKQKKLTPDSVKMNGNHYQRVDNCKADQSEMKAQCMACNTMQLIPNNSTKFYCFECRTLCICQQPQKLQKLLVKKGNDKNDSKLFICGCCSVKVRYQAKSSQYIRCTKCQTVNVVPQ